MPSAKLSESSRLRSRPTKPSTSPGSVLLRKSEVAALKRGKRQISVSAQKAFSSLKQKVDARRGRQ
jgi:hypothetical protein